MLRLIAFALVPLALASGIAAAGGGPSPGLMTGWDGTLDAARGVRYVAMPVGRSTIVAAVRTSDGRMLRYSTIRSGFGVPIVAFDGTTEGVSSDGRTLVLAEFGASPQQTRFAVMSTSRLRLQKVVTLRGLWALDALSRDGRTLYATEYLSNEVNARYNVRAVSLVTGKLLGGAIVDKREPDEEMNGAPWSRVRNPSGAWAYTLYAKPNGTAFVHALDTSSGRAFCIDLPWRSSTQALSAVRLSLADNGRSLVLSKPGSGRLALVNTRTFKVKALANP